MVEFYTHLKRDLFDYNIPLLSRTRGCLPGMLRLFVRMTSIWNVSLLPDHGVRMLRGRLLTEKEFTLGGAGAHPCALEVLQNMRRMRGWYTGWPRKSATLTITNFQRNQELNQISECINA